MKSPTFLCRREHLLGAIAAGVLCILAVGCGKGDRAGSDDRAPAREVVVAGASGIVFIMEEIVSRFEAEHDIKVKFVPGSSGNLAAQLREGAPYDVFFSANVGFVDNVIEAGVCLADTKASYALGRIVLWAPPDADPPPPSELRGLLDPRYRKIAVANPAHAPYGAAAKRAMEKLGIWDELQGRLVYGNNIKDTMQFVETGNAEVGILALSLTKKSPGTYFEIPHDLHQPIEQALVVCKQGRSVENGRAFVSFVRSDEVRQLWLDYGYALPDDVSGSTTP